VVEIVGREQGLLENISYKRGEDMEKDPIGVRTV